MNLNLNLKLVENYKSNSQKVRVLTENWTEENIFCSNCGKNLLQHKNNNFFGDFYCENCLEDYELKSCKNKFSKKILAGAYSKTIEKIRNKKKPNLFLLNYSGKMSVNNFFVIPKYFIVEEIIEKRKKLSEKARRKGFIGANILFDKIPKIAKVYYIKDEKVFSKKEILKNWEETLFFKKIKKTEKKGWILDILNCIESLNKKNFNLQDVYNFEEDLKLLYPNNNNIKAKIRQQLQFLREKNLIKFLNKGEYRLI